MSGAKKRENPDTAFLYVMGIEGGPTKVGYSTYTDLRKRMLSRDLVEDIFLVGEWPIGKFVAMHAERYAHYLLRDKHYRGEWFACSHDEAIEAVKAALDKPWSNDLLIPPLDVRGRDILLGEHVPTKFPSGTKAAIQAALLPDEGRADFIRSAVAHELESRGHTPPPVR